MVRCEARRWPSGGGKLPGPEHKIHFSRPVSIVSWVPALSHTEPRPWRAGDAPLCHLFDSAPVIVQVRGRSGPRGARRLWAAPSQGLFVLLVLLAGGHRVVGQPL